ncbi:MAG: glycosyltransferase family 4 protein [Pseudomonadota bacterium]
MPLSVTHLSHNDMKGGGALACYRLHRALLDQGAESRMLVLKRYQRDATVTKVDAGPFTTPIHAADRLLRRAYRKRMADRIWSPGCFGIGGVQRHPLVQDSDILSLYWINGGFLSVGGVDRILRLNKPVVWRLSDLWPLTGGCHHPGDCDRFKTACACCPQLGSHAPHDLASRQWQRKLRWPKQDLTVVAPSKWLADLAAESALLRGVRIEHITTGIDLDIFKPLSKAEARHRLGLPLDRQLILFGANNATANPRKGFSELVDALRILRDQNGETAFNLVLFGGDRTPALPLDLTLHDQGVIEEEAEKACLFAAADLFVTPSLEENLPNTVIEAMAAGTPAVAFDVGGTGELIDHGATGYLASPGDSVDLARGLKTVLSTTASSSPMGERAHRAIAVAHDQRDIARRYLDLFSELRAARKPVQA